MSRYLHNLILQGENQSLDFKFEISDAPKIARTFASFANTQGGRLLIGVKDNGNIAGIRSDEEIYMIESSAHIFCKPRVEYEVVHHRVREKTVLEVIIPESKNKPHTAPWKDGKYRAFVRVNDENFLADNVIIEVWNLKHNDKKVRVKYDDFEQKLFKLLNEKEEIVFKEFTKTCKVKPYLAKKILANMIHIGLIDFRIVDQEVFYRLK